MEPIRSDRSRRTDRSRTRSRGTTGSAGEGGFADRLKPEAVDAADDAAPAAETLAHVSLPSGVDAPTEKLFDAVHEAGERLLHQRTYSAAQAYREAVQRFLRKVLPEANSVQVLESGYGILSRKRYYLLTTINQSVNRLVDGLLQTQRTQMDILRRLEEIQGMLIDLVH